MPKFFKPKGDVGLHLIAPLAALAALAILTLYLSLIFIGQKADRDSEQWERSLVMGSLEGKFSTYIAGRETTLSQADPKDPPVATDDQRMLVIDPEGEVDYLLSGPNARAVPEAALMRTATPAIRDLATAQPFAPLDAPVGVVVATVAESPTLILAVRSEVQPGAILVDMTDLRDFIGDFAAKRHLSDAHLAAVDVTPRPGDTLAGVHILGAAPQIALQWRPRALGHDIVMRTLPFILGVTLLITAGGIFFVIRTQRLARSLVASEAHAQHLALHDPMTGLANRALFTDRLEHALEHRRRNGGVTAVVCVDLDRFKQVNDTLGHQAGDAMIKEAARRISAVSRASDTVARLGGDEFAVVLSPIADREAVEMVCRRLTDSLSARLDLPSGQASLSASLGVSIVDTNAVDGADAMRQADLALYRAKAEGRGRYCLFEVEMDESLKLRHEIENDLRVALSSGALEVHYQPQYTARGRMDGVEALARWNHPVRGAIAPAYFIPIAEEAGLIDSLGLFVMRQAFSDAQRWPALKMAINVSPVQLRRPDFVERAQGLLNEFGLEASRIELEITEGVLLENEPRVQAALRRLREIGFKLALDDFGTGYSSLSYLNVYPVDKIKIDRSFVSNLGLEGDADKVVRAIIRLGKVLGLSVTAEGVENEAQRSKLIAAGCTSLQGYLHGMPSAASVIDRLIADQDARRVAA